MIPGIQHIVVKGNAAQKLPPKRLPILFSWTSSPASALYQQRQFRRIALRSYTSLGRQPFAPQQYTEYRITKPFVPGSDYQDLYLAEPSRDDFVRFTKNDPTFLRFLKLVTDEEGRSEAFKTFVQRCEAGLVVEKAVYITKKELLTQLWENGYSDMEIHAYEMAFPDNYTFHYPELAVLFDLSEEDCYKYCLRVRAAQENNDLVELKHKSTPNMLGSYGLLSSALWFGAQNNVLGNIWMMVKTWPFFAVFYMLASQFQQGLSSRIHRTTTMECAISTEHRLEGEEAVYTKMKQYHNDRRCLEHVQAFEASTAKQCQQLKRALLLQCRDRLIESVIKHLIALQQNERSIGLTLQEIQVGETVNAFHHDFSTNPKLRESALDAAIQALERSREDLSATNLEDPIGDYFRSVFRSFRSSSSTKHNAIVERVNKTFNQQERQFFDQFTVRPEEAERVQQLFQKTIQSSAYGRDRFQNKQATPPPIDLSQLTDAEQQELHALSKTLLQRVGLQGLISPETPTADLASSDADCLPLLQSVKERVEDWNREMRDTQLRRFLTAFS